MAARKAAPKRTTRSRRPTEPGTAPTVPKPVAGQERLFDVSEIPDEAQERADHLAQWWLQTCQEDIKYLVPKAIQYGSADLEIMGEAMLVLLPECRGKVEGQELAVAFYLLGKVARMFGAYAQGQRPSDDTWYDARIYGGMGQHIRQFGGW